MGQLLYVMLINAMAMPVIVKEINGHINPSLKYIRASMWLFVISQSLTELYGFEVYRFIINIIN